MSNYTYPEYFKHLHRQLSLARFSRRPLDPSLTQTVRGELSGPVVCKLSKTEISLKRLKQNWNIFCIFVFRPKLSSNTRIHIINIYHNWDNRRKPTVDYPGSLRSIERWTKRNQHKLYSKLYFVQERRKTCPNMN